MWRKVVRALLYLAIPVGIAVGVVSIFFTTWTIPSDDPQLGVSIEPTLSMGDFVLVSRGKSAADGALVRCADPDAPGRFVIGRVIGHTGDKIEFKDGAMLVNDALPTSSVACEQSTVRLRNPGTGEDEDLGCVLEEFAGSTHAALRAPNSAERNTSAVVEPARVYLVSDDRELHLDSRDFGTVPPSTCQRIALRFWGLSGWGDTKKRLTVLW